MKSCNLKQRNRLDPGIQDHILLEKVGDGPVINFNSEDKKELFEKFKEPEGIYDDELGLVLKVKNDHVTLINKKKTIKLLKNQMSLISMKKNDLKNIFKPGDV